MKRSSPFLFAVAALQLCQDLSAQAPAQTSPATPPVIDPRVRPPMSMTQALAIAERELATRGFAANHIIKVISFQRQARLAESFYVAQLDPIESATPNPAQPIDDGIGRSFFIDMKGNVRLSEAPKRRVKAEPGK